MTLGVANLHRSETMVLDLSASELSSSVFCPVNNCATSLQTVLQLYLPSDGSHVNHGSYLNPLSFKYGPASIVLIEVKARLSLEEIVSLHKLTNVDVALLLPFISFLFECSRKSMPQNRRTKM